MLVLVLRKEVCAGDSRVRILEASINQHQETFGDSVSLETGQKVLIEVQIQREFAGGSEILDLQAYSVMRICKSGMPPGEVAGQAGERTDFTRQEVEHRVEAPMHVPLRRCKRSVLGSVECR